MISDALEITISKLNVLQDKIQALKAQEEAELQNKKQQQLLLLSVDATDVSVKMVQLQRHQKQLDLVTRRRNSLQRRCVELGKVIDATACSIHPVERKKNTGEIFEG